jgi:hypothetical protein
MHSTRCNFKFSETEELNAKTGNMAVSIIASVIVQTYERNKDYFCSATETAARVRKVPLSK